MSCPICLEEADTGLAVTLAGCGHSFCKVCIETWIQRLEATTSDPKPTCPECRCDICGEEIIFILGRPLGRDTLSETITHAAAGFGDDEEDENADRYYEPDEFTQVYLQELEDQGIARRCPSCRAWIILDEGCNNVMCRCGCKFCFCCGQRGSCIGATFFNNILEQEDEEQWLGRHHMVEEEEENVIDPIFEGELWYAVEEDAEAQIDPLFEGEAWMPTLCEAEDSLISPLFDGWAWWCSGSYYPAHRGVLELVDFWEDLYEHDPWAGDEGEYFGAGFFDQRS